MRLFTFLVKCNWTHKCSRARNKNIIKHSQKKRSVLLKSLMRNVCKLHCHINDLLSPSIQKENGSPDSYMLQFSLIIYTSYYNALCIQVFKWILRQKEASIKLKDNVQNIFMFDTPKNTAFEIHIKIDLKNLFLTTLSCSSTIATATGRVKRNHFPLLCSGSLSSRQSP